MLKTNFISKKLILITIAIFAILIPLSVFAISKTCEPEMKRVLNKYYDNYYSNNLEFPEYVKNNFVVCRAYQISYNSSGYILIPDLKFDSKTFEYYDSITDSINYAYDKNSVYVKTYGYSPYGVMQNFNPGRWDKLPNTDAETFEALEYGFSKDKNYVFYYGDIVQDADPKSFQVTSGNSAIDEDSCFDSFNQFKGIEGCDPNTWNSVYSFLPGRYTKDKNNCYHEAKKLENCNPETFDDIDVIIHGGGGNSLMSDGKNVFIDGQNLNIKNPENIYIFNESGFTDGDNCYVSTKSEEFYIIKNCDKNTIKKLGIRYLTDGKLIYHQFAQDSSTKPILDNVDINSFEELREYYAKDNQNCYDRGEIVEYSKCDGMEFDR